MSPCLQLPRIGAEGIADGTYHLTASGRTSWHGLAQHIVQKAIEHGFVSAVDPANIEAITTEEFPRPAARPGKFVAQHECFEFRPQVYLA